MAEQFIDTSVALVSAHIFDAEAKPGRPLIVAIHGGGFTHKYYDSGSFSFREQAQARGMGIILLDRPGYGRSHFKNHQGDILSDNVAALSEAVGKLWVEFGSESSGIYLVGHSIGGAIALMLAAASRDWPLVAISVSGIGDAPPQSMPREAALPSASQNAGLTYMPSGRAMFCEMFLAPGAASEEALAAMEAAAFPVIVDEVRSLYGNWAPSALSTLSQIQEPVQLILAEHEVLWQSDELAIARIRQALNGNPHTDVRAFPEVGHCIDFHQARGDFHDQVFGFVE